jgi:hypothetical protein
VEGGGPEEEEELGSAAVQSVDTAQLVGIKHPSISGQPISRKGHLND